MTTESSKATPKKAPKAAKRAASEVVTFRLPIKEYDELAKQARESKVLIGDLVRDRFRSGIAFEGLADELRAQRDAFDSARDELAKSQQELEARVAVQVRALLQEDVIKQAIRAGVEAGVARVMRKIYEEGQSPTERRTRDAAARN